MALTEEVECEGVPFLGKLKVSSVGNEGDGHKMGTYSSSIDSCAYKNQGRHQHHPVERHAVVLDRKAVEVYAMRDEKDCA